MTKATKPRVTITPEDRAEHAAWVAAWVARTEAMDGFRIDVFHSARMWAAGVEYAPADAWKGPRFLTERFWTEEFRNLVNEGVIPRVTLTEWAERAAVARGQLETAEAEAAEAADLEQLAYIRDMLAERDSIIVRARKSGATVPALVESTGLGRSQVHKILSDAKRAEAIAERMADVYASQLDDDGQPF